MKAKSFAARILLALAIAAAAAACVKFDDSGIQSELSDIKSRLSALEQKANTDIAGLWEIVNALKGGITISSIGETDDAWIILFSNGKTATLSKGGAGSTPVVGVKQDTDGIYYWTLHGQWMLDSDGKKLPVSGTPGQSPQLKIEGGDWYVSTDGGKTWTKLGKATGEDGDAFFKDVTWDDDYVYLTLSNGTKIKLLRGAGLVASIAAIPDYSDGSVKAGTGLFTIRFKVEPESAAKDLLHLDAKCFKLSAAYTQTKAAEGELITLPVHKRDVEDGIFTITTTGEDLAPEFTSNKMGVSAALFISDGASLSVSSGYFPLYPKNEYKGHGYVDLGLESGTKFADTNLGAGNPWEPGNYYAWGELKPKDTYDWSTYQWCDGTEDNITKYNKTDGLKSFADDAYNDDVVRQEWGGEWRTPTDEDWRELMDASKFKWTWTINSGTYGYEVTSKMPGHEGKSIFLPVTGFRDGIQQSGKTVGRYWSSSLNSKDHRQAANFYTSSTIYGVGSEERHLGMAIRPVIGKYEAKSIKGVSIVPGSLTLTVGMSRHLNVRLEPENADNPKVTWSSGNPGVATVAKDGTVTAVSVGTTTVTVKTVDGGFTATCAVTVISPSDVPAPEAVDLGLSVKWANMNVGAISPEDYGDYFAWGETEPKKEYLLLNYKFKLGTDYKCLFSKYITKSSYGTVDNKTVLDPEDDAAHVNWGGSWRMPTDEECDELINNCTWTWTTENGVKGIKLTGPNGKSIFLPAAGYRYDADLVRAGSDGYYWSSSLDTVDPARAWFVYFCSVNVFRRSYYRWYGLSVRPVYGEFIPVASISLDKTSLELNAGDKQQLTATVSPSNATAKDVHWISSDESIAKVDEDGLVTAVAPGTATITAYGSSGVSASCTVTVKEGVQAVDLGLPSGLKWASCNVGATRPEEFGDYFAWGETEPNYSSQDPLTWKDGKTSGYDWPSYKWCNGSENTQTKYNTKSSYGTVDNKTVLDPEDDAAHVNWGGSWRMPTDAEWTELKTKCTLTWTTQNGVNGRLVTGPNGKSIFLPAAGARNDTRLHNAGSYGYYWSSSLFTDFPYVACYVYFSPGNVYWYNNYRYYGFSVRPVYGEFIPVKSISLDKTSLELNAGDKQQLTATLSPSNATAKDVLWISSDESIAKVYGDGLVTAVAPGTATITAYGSSGVSASCTVTVKEGVQAVDLGLPSGLKWASCNVGATKPEQFGDYFSWGETETKNEYTWSTYKWGNGDWDADEHLSKYNTDPSCGNVDGNTMLLPEDDVAQDKWKGGWRMPTDAEWTELRDYCTWTWTVSYEGTGVAGYIVEGTKNSSIFLPATGHMEDEFVLDPGVNCGYWSSNIDPDNPAYAWFVYFEEGGVYRTIGPRKYGYSVRPVSE